MPVKSPLSLLPLWAVFVLTVVLIMVAVEIGFQIGCRRRRNSEEAGKGPVGEIVTAMLGLLALLLAFTFSQAASHYDRRRTLVVDEANAVGTTWLRAGLLAEPQRSEARQLLREYLDARIKAVASGQILEGVARSEEIQRQLWDRATTASQKEPMSISVGLFVNSLNELIDLHAKRVQVGMRTRIPVVIWGLLYCVTFFAIGAIGYHHALLRQSRSFAILVLVLTFACVLLLITDLDRPQEGLLRVGQQALVDTRKVMEEPGR